MNRTFDPREAGNQNTSELCELETDTSRGNIQVISVCGEQEETFL